MRRIVLFLILACGLSNIFAQQPSERPATPVQPKGHAEAVGKRESVSETAQEGAEAENLRYAGWKWANFAILAIVLGYLVKKNVPQYFRARSEEIQREISEANRLRRDAETRVARIEMRLSALHSEIQQIRQEAHAEMSKERDRILKDADQHVGRLRVQAEQEIEAISKHASQELKAQAAELAITLASDRIRGRMSERTDAGLVHKFVRQLDTYADGRGARAR
jgi:F-type H+-transporting ATPase subunit b